MEAKVTLYRMAAMHKSFYIYFNAADRIFEKFSIPESEL